MFDFYDTSQFTLSDCNRTFDLIGIINGRVQMTNFPHRDVVLTRISLLLPTRQQGIVDIWNSSDELHPIFASDWKSLQLCVIKCCNLTGFFKIDDKKVLHFKAREFKSPTSHKFIWLSEDQPDFWEHPVGLADKTYEKKADEQLSWPDLPQGPSGFLRPSSGSVLQTRHYTIEELDTSFHMADIEPFYWEDIEKLQKSLKSALLGHVSHYTNKIKNKQLLFHEEIDKIKTQKMTNFNTKSSNKKMKAKAPTRDQTNDILAILRQRKSSEQANNGLETDSSSKNEENCTENKESFSSSESEDEIATTSRKTRSKLVYTSSESEDNVGMSDSERPTLFNDNDSDENSVGIMPNIPDAEFERKREAITKTAKETTGKINQEDNMETNTVALMPMSSDDENRDRNLQITAICESSDNESAESGMLHSPDIIPPVCEINPLERKIEKLSSKVERLEDIILSLRRTIEAIKHN